MNTIQITKTDTGYLLKIDNKEINTYMTAVIAAEMARYYLNKKT